jgi:hypothetical protein
LIFSAMASFVGQALPPGALLNTHHLLDWLKEDIPALDIGGYVVGDAPRTGTLYLKEAGRLAGLPWLEAIFRLLAAGSGGREDGQTGSVRTGLRIQQGRSDQQLQVNELVTIRYLPLVVSPPPGPSEPIYARDGLNIPESWLSQCPGGRLPLLEVHGPARLLLAAERLMLNLLARASGIATVCGKARAIADQAQWKVRRVFFALWLLCTAAALVFLAQ